MKIRENSEALAIFNKILAAEQTLDSAKLRIPPCEGRDYLDRASKLLEEASELLELFVEGMKGGAA